MAEETIPENHNPSMLFMNYGESKIENHYNNIFKVEYETTKMFDWEK